MKRERGCGEAIEWINTRRDNDIVLAVVTILSIPPSPGSTFSPLPLPPPPPLKLNSPDMFAICGFMARSVDGPIDLIADACLLMSSGVIDAMRSAPCRSCSAEVPWTAAPPPLLFRDEDEDEDEDVAAPPGAGSFDMATSSAILSPTSSSSSPPPPPTATSASTSSRKSRRSSSLSIPDNDSGPTPLEPSPRSTRIAPRISDAVRPSTDRGSYRRLAGLMAMAFLASKTYTSCRYRGASPSSSSSPPPPSLTRGGRDRTMPFVPLRWDAPTRPRRRTLLPTGNGEVDGGVVIARLIRPQPRRTTRRDDGDRKLDCGETKGGGPPTDRSSMLFAKSIFCAIYILDRM